MHRTLNQKAMMYRTAISLILLIMIASCKDSPPGVAANTETPTPDIIAVEYPETYELANVVLALTDYGINDKWQVRKDFDYYDEMRAYFGEHMDHPLLDSVNFSREEWQEYLSYRTDAYAFVLTDGYELRRQHAFNAFDVQTFDDHRELTEDFARKTRFKDFFRQNRSRYDKIVETYKQEYLLAEMKDFLTEEFGNFFDRKQYSVVLSPFVYAQNLHRDIDSTWTADFPTIAKPIIEGSGFTSPKEKSQEIHTLFTEMNHGYVNPVTSQYDIPDRFDENVWSNDSGYEGYGDAVFNEYMTWAVFNVFNAKHFPDIADEVNLSWHFQNDSRGFPYSNLFATKLQSLYAANKGEKKVRELYPEMLTWADSVQLSLSKPVLLNDSDTIRRLAGEQVVELRFSEPMEKTDSLDFVLQYGQWDTENVRIGGDNLKWNDAGTSLTFDYEFNEKANYYLLFNWWGVNQPIVGKNGVLLEGMSGFWII